MPKSTCPIHGKSGGSELSYEESRTQAQLAQLRRTLLRFEKEKDALMEQVRRVQSENASLQLKNAQLEVKCNNPLERLCSREEIDAAVRAETLVLRNKVERLESQLRARRESLVSGSINNN